MEILATFLLVIISVSVAQLSALDASMFSQIAPETAGLMPNGRMENIPGIPMKVNFNAAADMPQQIQNFASGLMHTFTGTNGTPGKKKGATKSTPLKAVARKMHIPEAFAPEIISKNMHNLGEVISKDSHRDEEVVAEKDNSEKDNLSSKMIIVRIIRRVAEACIKLGLLNDETFFVFETGIRFIILYAPDVSIIDKEELEKLIGELKDKVKTND